MGKKKEYLGGHYSVLSYYAVNIILLCHLKKSIKKKRKEIKSLRCTHFQGNNNFLEVILEVHRKYLSSGLSFL